MNKNFFLSDAQLKAEADRCLYCEDKPCKTACPADCSPADFLMAVRQGENSDIIRAAKLILSKNPVGGICGAVCPDWFCVKACSRKLFDNPINIPAAQAAIIEKAKKLGMPGAFKHAKRNGKRIAIIGGGPAGLAAAGVLAQLGYTVDIFEKQNEAGGACGLIPDSRLPKNILKTELEFIKSLGKLSIKTSKGVQDPSKLLKTYHAVLVTAGVEKQLKLGIPREELGVEGLEFLRNKKQFKLKGKKVAIVGGGAVAADCAIEALRLGAQKAEIFTRKNIGEIQLPQKELSELLLAGVNINGKSRLTAILPGVKEAIGGIKVIRLDDKSRDITGSEQQRPDIDFVILAIKNMPVFENKNTQGVFFAGDAKNGPSTVVESAASGKNAAMLADAYLTRKESGLPQPDTNSDTRLTGLTLQPVDLTTYFFGRKISSPFIISASPHTDGYDQVKQAYEAGWPGVVMKTAFDGLDIHIPAQYMVTFSDSTYGNSDNVSGHPLDRVCAEIKKLVKEYPDRLTAASTGGPVTGNDEADKKVWQANTLKLEKAGAMAVEYSLSCPQGGDGTKGDIVSQDPELAAKIIGWVMEISNPDIPKLFKLTGAVTSIYQVVDAIKNVYARYPNKKAGITLANSFPSMAFRKGKGRWDEGMVVGMSGEGVTPISYLTLAKAAKLKVPVSGNGGPMDYKAAANFLALGAQTVQFCTIVMKYGFGIIDELNQGLSHLLEEKKMKSVKDLIGAALPKPITEFMELTAEKSIPELCKELCRNCGNCQRCGYLAIKLNKERLPEIDASKCIGCSLCVKKCFTGALSMRRRTKSESAVTTD